jgi:hypothetical protein
MPPAPPFLSLLPVALLPYVPASDDLPPPLFYGASVPFFDDSDSDSDDGNVALPPLLPSKHVCYASDSDSDDDDTSPLPFSQPRPRTFVIEVPPKIWRPKPIDRYIPMDYSNDIDDSVFEFQQFGNAICHPPEPFVNVRTDVHLWDRERDLPEFAKNFVIGTDVSPAIRASIVAIIEPHWDCFYGAGVKFPILYFEFAIDTGASPPPVCCKKPHYGPHESHMIMEQLEVLKANGWIRKCFGPWGSSVVLAAKPHQEHIHSIEDFIWRLCLSYRRLNQVTLPFECPLFHVATMLLITSATPLVVSSSLPWITKPAITKSVSGSRTRRS